MLHHVVFEEVVYTVEYPVLRKAKATPCGQSTPAFLFLFLPFGHVAHLDLSVPRMRIRLWSAHDGGNIRTPSPFIPYSVFFSLHKGGTIPFVCEHCTFTRKVAVSRYAQANVDEICIPSLYVSDCFKTRKGNPQPQ